MLIYLGKGKVLQDFYLPFSIKQLLQDWTDMLRKDLKFFHLFLGQFELTPLYVYSLSDSWGEGGTFQCLHHRVVFIHQMDSGYFDNQMDFRLMFRKWLTMQIHSLVMNIPESRFRMLTNYTNLEEKSKSFLGMSAEVRRSFLMNNWIRNISFNRPFDVNCFFLVK